MYYETLADRVRFFEESKEGVMIMCKVLEDMRYESWQESVREGKKEGIKEGIKIYCLCCERSSCLNEQINIFDNIVCTCCV